MEDNLQTKSGKVLRAPFRMFKTSDLDDMQIEFVERQVFFNKTNQDQPFEKVNDQINENMGVINYPDCSYLTFSKKILKSVVEEQIKMNGEFIILPYFKDETEYDVVEKIELAEILKRGFSKKDIILEVSYKLEDVVIQNQIIPAAKSEKFDHLALFYGVHYGQYPAFDSICKKIVFFKMMTGKRVFCVAVPMIFSGDRKIINSRLLPIWSLVCDGWIRNWRQGGGSNSIKLVDFIDLKNKDFQGWLESGHQTGEVVSHVGTTVYSLFKEGHENEPSRKRYKKIIEDEILSEVYSVTPNTIESFLRSKCPEIYIIPIEIAYTEKMIQKYIRNAPWSNERSFEDLWLLENHLRKNLSPRFTQTQIELIEKLVRADKKIPISEMIKELNRLTNSK
ncbi:MAG: hypothetical protein HY516_02205 [Candidatus Aenigmarchaeota archaeon]|nr:hypothetical protein [Candidatus Aenigmarchaeota archaeon]